MVSGSRRSPEERIWAGERIICPRWIFLSGSNRFQFGLRYLLHSIPCWPGRSVVGPADIGPSPCADVGQPDFGWSVRPPATLIALCWRWKRPSLGLFTRSQGDPPLAIPKLDRKLVHSPSLLHVTGSASLLGPVIGWGGAGLVCNLVARCGCRWRATPKIATVWPTQSCVAGGPSAT